MISNIRVPVSDVRVPISDVRYLYPTSDIQYLTFDKVGLRLGLRQGYPTSEIYIGHPDIDIGCRYWTSDVDIGRRIYILDVR